MTDESKSSTIGSGVGTLIFGIALFFIGSYFVSEYDGIWFPSDTDKMMLTLGRALEPMGILIVAIGIAIVAYGLAKPPSPQKIENMLPTIVVSPPPVNKSVIYCLKCGREVPNNSRICPYCGFNLKLPRGSCGREIPPDSNMCPYCRNNPVMT